MPGVQVVDTLAYLLGRLDSLVAGQQSLVRRLDSLADELTENKVFDWLKSQSTVN